MESLCAEAFSTVEPFVYAHEGVLAARVAATPAQTTLDAPKPSATSLASADGAPCEERTRTR